MKRRSLSEYVGSRNLKTFVCPVLPKNAERDVKRRAIAKKALTGLAKKFAMEYGRRKIAKAKRVLENG